MKNKERKLTEKEQQRKEKFDILCEKMASEGYVKTDLTVGVVAANFIAIVIMAPFMALALLALSGCGGVLFYCFRGNGFFYNCGKPCALSRCHSTYCASRAYSRLYMGLLCKKPFQVN